MAKPKSTRRSPTAISRALGKRVRLLRVERGWSIEHLAERADIHNTYLSSIENGNRNPTLNVLADLARALNSTVSKLTDGI